MSVVSTRLFSLLTNLLLPPLCLFLFPSYSFARIYRAFFLESTLYREGYRDYLTILSENEEEEPIRSIAGRVPTTVSTVSTVEQDPWKFNVENQIDYRQFCNTETDTTTADKENVFKLYLLNLLEKHLGECALEATNCSTCVLKNDYGGEKELYDAIEKWDSKMR